MSQRSPVAASRKGTKAAAALRLPAALGWLVHHIYQRREDVPTRTLWRDFGLVAALIDQPHGGRSDAGLQPKEDVLPMPSTRQTRYLIRSPEYPDGERRLGVAPGGSRPIPLTAWRWGSTVDAGSWRRRLLARRHGCTVGGARRVAAAG